MYLTKVCAGVFKIFCFHFTVLLTKSRKLKILKIYSHLYINLLLFFPMNIQLLMFSFLYFFCQPVERISLRVKFNTSVCPLIGYAMAALIAMTRQMKKIVVSYTTVTFTLSLYTLMLLVEAQQIRSRSDCGSEDWYLGFNPHSNCFCHTQLKPKTIDCTNQQTMKSNEQAQESLNRPNVQVKVQVPIHLHFHHDFFSLQNTSKDENMGED